MISKGEKILVITRRLFDGDLRRHFVGEVQETTSTAMRIKGYSFVFDEATLQFVRHDEKRIRIFSFIDSGLVIFILPSEVCMDDISYKWEENNRRIITDGKMYKMNISEFGVHR
jgi:hypothetical protein